MDTREQRVLMGLETNPFSGLPSDASRRVFGQPVTKRTAGIFDPPVEEAAEPEVVRGDPQKLKDLIKRIRAKNRRGRDATTRMGQKGRIAPDEES